MQKYLFIVIGEGGQSDIRIIKAESIHEAAKLSVIHSLHWCLDDVPDGEHIDVFVDRVLRYIASDENYQDGDSRDKVLFIPLADIEVLPWIDRKK